MTYWLLVCALYIYSMHMGGSNNFFPLLPAMF